jgi:hypothetical protein
MNCQTHLYRKQHPLAVSRRWFLKECGVGLGAIALHTLLGNCAVAAAKPGETGPLAPKQPHFPAKAKRVIYLFMAGAPSHLELFDNKPQLAKFNGTLPPPELLKGYRAAFINPNSTLLGPKFKFARHGKSGAELSEILPHLAEVADAGPAWARGRYTGWVPSPKTCPASSYSVPGAKARVAAHPIGGPAFCRRCITA